MSQISDFSDRPQRRRKRDRIAHAFKRLNDQVRLYRALALVAGLGLLVLGGYVLSSQSSPAPETVPLGTGRAGVDSVNAVADAARADSARAATLPAPAASAQDKAVASSPDIPPSEPIPGGQASYYGDELAGNPTASGERFDPNQLTAAHRTLPLGSRVRVTNLRTGSSVVVRINDRGPFHGQRVIDLSKAAARRIGMLQRGTARVELELLARR